MLTPNSFSLSIMLVVVMCAGLAMLLGLVYSTPIEQRKRTGIIGFIALALWMGVSIVYTKLEIGLNEPNFFYIAPFMMLNLLIAIGIGMSSWGKRLATLPIAALILFHLFRVPLEWVLHSFAQQGSVPNAISWHGQNYDVITPILGVLIVLFVKKHPKLVLVFELVGVLMLMNIMRIVFQRTPGSPLFIESDQPNLLLVAYFPTVWIVSVCVFGAIIGHTVIARWLWINFKKSDTLNENSSF